MIRIHFRKNSKKDQYVRGGITTFGVLDATASARSLDWRPIPDEEPMSLLTLRECWSGGTPRECDTDGDELGCVAEPEGEPAG